jgi:hypothetical protein
MELYKENYQKFEPSRLIFMAAAESTPAPMEAESAEPDENKENQDFLEKAGDQEAKFEAQQGKVLRMIDEMKDGVPEQQKDAVNELAKKIEAHSKEQFNKLLSNYRQQYEKIGSIQFEETEQFQKMVEEAEKLAETIIKNKIENKSEVQKSVTDFLDNVPRIKASQQEVDAIKTILKKNAAITELFGTDGNNINEISTALAKRYDITFNKKGEIEYAIDLHDRSLIEGGKFENRLEDVISVLENSDQLGDFLKNQEYATRQISSLRDTIENGKGLLSRGEIKEWDDWDKSEEAQTLSSIQTEIDRQIAIYRKEHPTEETEETMEAGTEKNEDPKENERLRAELERQFNDKKVENADETEMQAINDMEIEINGEKKKFSEAFPASVAQVLSMDHEFQTTENGQLQIKVGEEFQDVTAESLGQYLPESTQDSYNKKLKGEEGVDEKAFEDLANNEVKTREEWQKLQEVTKDPEKVKKAFKDMGPMEILSSLAQMFKIFKKAFDTGDFQSLNDAVADFSQGNNPAERLKEAETGYRDQVDKIENTSDLLSLYQDPYGEKEPGIAKEMFEGVPYRVQLKTAIQSKLEAVLGIDITGMENKTASITRIEGLDGNRKVKITLENRNGKALVSMDINEINGDESMDNTENVIPRQEVEGLTQGTDSLAYVLFQRMPESNTETTEAEKETTVDSIANTSDPNLLYETAKELYDPANIEVNPKLKEAVLQKFEDTLKKDENSKLKVTGLTIEPEGEIKVTTDIEGTIVNFYIKKEGENIQWTLEAGSEKQGYRALNDLQDIRKTLNSV